MLTVPNPSCLKMDVIFVCILWLWCSVLPVKGFQMTILHTNDIHARIDETNKYSEACTDPEGKCYGGMARLKTKIDEFRAENPNNTILLDAGDQFQGTLWFNHFGGIISSIFMNKLGYDAMSAGNHEFDHGIEGLLPFLRNVTFPFLSCNIDTSREPKLQGLIKTHHVITVDGEKIGIIGYTTTDTPIISNSGNLLFHDEVSSIRNIVTTLQRQGINKIIALGHSGYKVDKKIAAEVSGLDIIVGGHTNTFLYTGEAPSNDDPAGLYPTVITQANGNKVLVVQDYAYGKYLGVLNVTFDKDGNITSYSGNPVLLDYKTSKDMEVDNLTTFYKAVVGKTNQLVIGRTLVKLEGDRKICRLKECNLGNIIADGLVYQNLRHADTIDATTVFLSVVNSGSIRVSIDPGNITYLDAINAQPFRNTVERIKLEGKYLREALENSVSKYDPSAPDGRFLQLSGIRVTYDLKLPVGKRVVDVTVRCSDCYVPEFLPLNDTQKYGLLLQNFILSGGDGYSVIKEHAEQDVIMGDLDTDAFIEYVQEMSPLYQGLEGRIKFVDTSIDPCKYLTTPMTNTPKPCDGVGIGTSLTANIFAIIVSVLGLVLL